MDFVFHVKSFIDKEKLVLKLSQAGAEIFSNDYPLMFMTIYGMGIIKKNRNGFVHNDIALKAIEHMKHNASHSLWAGGKQKRKTSYKQYIVPIIKRDGDKCFLCGMPLGDDITVEHLVPLSSGGPNHIDNLFLAHKLCNCEASMLSVSEKINLHRKTKKY